jgi:hypothetical protein
MPVLAHENQVLSIENTVESTTSDALEQPLSSEITEVDEPIITHIRLICPDIKEGELACVMTMINEQLTDDDSASKLQFCREYWNNSDVIIAYGMTAKQLYNLGNLGGSKYYKDIVDSFDRIINNYGHMTPDEQVRFLKNKDNNFAYVQSFLVNSISDSMKFTWVMNETSQAMETYKEDMKTLPDNPIDVKKNMDKATEKWADAIQTASIYYDLLDGNGEDLSDIYNIIYNKTALSKLTTDQFKNIKTKLTETESSLNIVQYTIMGVEGAIGLVMLVLSIVTSAVYLIAIILFSFLPTLALGVMLFISGIILLLIMALLGYIVDLCFSPLRNSINTSISEVRSMIDIINEYLI